MVRPQGIERDENEVRASTIERMRLTSRERNRNDRGEFSEAALVLAVWR
jgi:hypothetical protein